MVQNKKRFSKVLLQNTNNKVETNNKVGSLSNKMQSLNKQNAKHETQTSKWEG
jgi:hypothetical protein